MIYLLDANAVRDLMDEHPQLAANVAAITSVDSVVVCSIVRGEVLFGIERLSPGKRRETLRNKDENLFTSLGEEPVQYSAGTAYAGLKRGRELAGRTMDENDLWIAATALALRAVLITRDTDFDQITGLTIKDWTK